MYEFKSSVGKNIVNDMTSNWQTACIKLQDNISGEPNLNQETHSLYHYQKHLPQATIQTAIYFCWGEFVLQ